MPSFSSTRSSEDFERRMKLKKLSRARKVAGRAEARVLQELTVNQPVAKFNSGQSAKALKKVSTTDTDTAFFQNNNDVNVTRQVY